MNRLFRLRRPEEARRAIPWEEQMDVARRLMAQGNEYRVTFTGRGIEGAVYVFFNRPDSSFPFSYTYCVPGHWVNDGWAGEYRSADGRGTAGIRFLPDDQLAGSAGVRLIDRACTVLMQEFQALADQQGLGPLPEPVFKSLPSDRGPTWEWGIPDITMADRGVLVSFPRVFLVDLEPDAVAQVTVHGTADDAGLAQRILATLTVTKDAEGFWPLLESCLRRAAGEGPASG